MTTTSHRYLIVTSAYSTKSGTRYEYGLPNLDLDTLLNLTETDVDALYAEVRQAAADNQLHRHDTFRFMHADQGRGDRLPTQQLIHHLWHSHSTAGDRQVRQSGTLYQHMMKDGMTFADAYRTTVAEFATVCHHQMEHRHEGSFDRIMGTGRRTTIHTCRLCGYEYRTEDVRRWSGD